MTWKEESGFFDYVAVGIIGFAVGQAISGVGGLGTAFLGLFATVNWGRTIAGNFVTGLFAFLPGGFAAGFLCYKLFNRGGRREGLTGGVMSFAVYFVLTLLLTIVNTVIFGGSFGSSLETWVVLMVFALIFFPLGGLLAGMMHANKMALPSLFRLEFMKSQTPPPPPPAEAKTCPTCGSPLRYIQEYQKWYCDKEKKYV